MNVLGVIPARGGSKRFPGKNIKDLLGKPLIAYTIEAALGSTKIDRLIVSTDDEKTALISEEYGAEVPFIRPKELSEDYTPDLPVFLHALEKLNEIDQYNPDIVVNLRPTSPFKTSTIVDNVINSFTDEKVDIVRTMTLSEGVHHPYWMYKLSNNGIASPLIKEININEYYQSQLLPPVYRINGVVDAYKAQKIYEGDILGGRITGLVISDRESMDIDTYHDFKICELTLLSEKQ